MFKTYHFSCALWITIGLLAISLTAVQSGPVDDNEIKKGRECKTFCGSCGCIGFYCGEECICECNEENKDDTKCIASIQTDARRKRIPFEILIQGPSGNRFLMNAQQFDQNQKECSMGDLGRSKRSTVVIYKPATANALDANGYCGKPLEKSLGLAKKQLFRGKRAVDRDSWFTDISNNNLVKPAPIPGKSIDAQEIEEVDEPAKVTVVESGENILPKIRGRIRNALNIGEDEDIVKGIRKTVKKIENKAFKAVERDDTAKKIRGAISTLRSRAEDILLSSAETPETQSDIKKTGRKILKKIRGRILSRLGDDNDLDGSFS